MRQPAVCLIALALALVVAVSGTGCGGPPETPHAKIGLLRVEVARMDLPLQGDEPAAEVKSRFRRAIANAERLEQFGIAAEAATHQGRWHEGRNELPDALACYREALRYDKQEHYRLRSKLDPLPNVSSIAVSLVNVSLVLEKQGDLPEAVTYGERAFRINRNLNLAGRMKFDAERLARLHEQLGNTASATRYRDIAASVEVAAALERPPTGDVPDDLPPVPEGGPGDDFGAGIGGDSGDDD